jgi:hypothetical protein
MQDQIEASTQLAQLASKLAQARAKATEAEAELKKAERRAERAGDAVAALREDYDRERMRLWGSKPDVAALLESDGSMAFYRAGEALAEAYGLGWGMKWADNNQTVLHVRLNRGEVGAVERTKAAVLYFAPFIKPKKGLVRFGVQHHESGEFAVELRYSLKTGAAQVGRLHFGQEDGAQSFKTLGAALAHIQESHWLEDFIDMPGATVLLG